MVALKALQPTVFVAISNSKPAAAGTLITGNYRAIHGLALGNQAFRLMHLKDFAGSCAKEDHILLHVDLRYFF